MQDVRINEVDVFTEATSDKESNVNILGDIEFSNVSFVYPSRKNTLALSNINLCARANRTTALVGPSGCGNLFLNTQRYTFRVFEWICREKHLYITSASTL